MSTDKKVLLLGSYGQTNLGDDLLMYNYLRFLTDRGFSTIYVNANTEEFIPAIIKTEYPNLKLLLTYETSPVRYLAIIREVDAVVYGGGTIYKELYSSTGRSPYSVITLISGMNAAARLLRTPVYNLHIGTGSIKTSLGRWISKLGLAASRFTVFRDEDSYLYARDKLKINQKKIGFSTDGLFLDRRWGNGWDESVLDIDRSKYKGVVGVNLLSDIPEWVDRNSYIEAVTGFVQHLSSENYYVLFMPFQHDFNKNNDHTFMQSEILTRLKGDDFNLLDSIPLEQLSDTYKKVDIFVGMRFHSLLLATVTSTPFLAIAYDTKCWRFTSSVDYEYALKLEGLTTVQLIDMFQNIVKNKTSIVSALENISGQNYDKADQCLEEIDF